MNMTRGTRRLLSFTFPAALAMAMLTATASAQTPDQTAAQTTTAQISTPGRSAYWASIGGFEGDTHGTGYGFFGPRYVRPINDNMAVTGSIYGNYLFYEFDSGIGTTTVRSPGASAMLGLQFGQENLFGVSAGPSFKHRRSTDVLLDGQRIHDNDVRVGLAVGGDMYVNPTSHNNIQGLLTHDTGDEYTWGRLAFKEQLTNHNWSGRFAHFLGAEFIGQGNEDIKSQQYGAFVEFTHVPSTISVMLRGGYKNSSFQASPDKSGPYFAVGFYQRIR
jgi:hypothetical protein